MLSLGGVTTQEWSVYDNGYEAVGRYNASSLEEVKRFRSIIVEKYKDYDEEPFDPPIQTRTVITWPNGAMYLSAWKDVDEGH